MIDQSTIMNIPPDLSEKEIEPENVIECIYKLSDLDKEILSILSDGKELKSSEIAEKLEKDQSTAYRALEKLLDCGLIYKEKHNIRNGGYYFLYSRRPIKNIKKETKKYVDHWYEEITDAIDELDEI